MRRVPVLWLALLALAGPLTAAEEEPMSSNRAGPVLEHADVPFMYASDEKAYKAYGATFVAWGGANNAEKVRRHRDLGIRCTGSMWCLTAGAQLLYDNADLRDAVARDIEGRPVAVPWLFDHTYKEMKSYFGCTNHPAFRRLNRDKVREAMAGGADGLHVDDHLGVAQAATAFGGGLCDHCIAAFRQYLKDHATPDQLAEAGIADLETFDYRDLIRKHAKTADEYRKVRRTIPLMDLFDRFHLETAAENIRQLREVGAKAAGHPILLSANAWVGDARHRVVAKHLTHVVCEVEFHARQGTAGIDGALGTFETARRLGKPLAGTASGWDWAHVKATGHEELARFWIALTYAHGQWFMVPHPKRQWCYTQELGTHWYEAPIEAYAPLYRFIRANARWFDRFESVEGPLAKAPATVVATLRRKGDAGPVVLHVVNRDYDAKADRIRPAKNVRIGLPADLVKGLKGEARGLAYDADSVAVPVETDGGAVTVVLPDLRLWTVVVIE